MTDLDCLCLTKDSHADAIRAFEAAVHDKPEALRDHYSAFVWAYPSPGIVLACSSHWIDAALKVVGTDVRFGTYLDPKTNQTVVTGPIAWASTLVRTWASGDVLAFAKVLEDMPFEQGPVVFFWVFDMCVRICRDDYVLMWKDCDHDKGGTCE